jgi:endonuclease IV
MKNVKLGMHLSPGDLINRELDCRKNFSAVQIFLGSPQTFSLGDAAKEFLIKYESMFDIYAHGPFVLNMVNIEHKTHEATVKYLMKAAEFGQYGLKGLVVHPGRVFTKAQFDSGEAPSRLFGDQSFTRVIEMVLPVFERNGVKLLLENSVGTSFGSALDDIAYLFAKVRHFNNPYLRVCLDTEHAFAAGDPGIDALDLYRRFKDLIGLVHLNAIEEGVKKGNRKDRHSNTTFDICTHYPVEAYIKFIEQMNDKTFIFERGSNINLGLKDAKTLYDGGIPNSANN